MYEIFISHKFILNLELLNIENNMSPKRTK